MFTSVAASISSTRTRRCCPSTSRMESRRSAMRRAICRSKCSRGGVRLRAAGCSVRPCSSWGPKIEGIKPVWKGTLEAGSQAEVDAAIAKLKALDVDFVKITDSTLKPELFLYAVREPQAAGLRTSGHIPMGHHCAASRRCRADFDRAHGLRGQGRRERRSCDRLRPLPRAAGSDRAEAREQTGRRLRSRHSEERV